MLSSSLLFKMLILPLEFSRFILLLILVFFVCVIGGLSKTGSYHMLRMAHISPMIPLPQPSKCWNYGCMP